MSGNKKINSDVEILGKATVTGVQRPEGTNQEIFLADGTIGLRSGPAANPDGWIYFNAAYKQGLTYSVTGEYILGGILYTLRQTDLTVVADPSDPVIHVFAGDDQGNLVIVPGTPGTGLAPTVDPVSQLYGTFVSLAAGASVPDGIVQTNIYFENLGTAGGEWNTAFSGGTIVGNGTAINGSVAIEGTNSVSGNRVTFTPSGDIDLEANPVSHLNYLIQNKTAINGKSDTHRFVANGLDGAGNPVSIALTADPAYDLQSTSSQFLSLLFPDFVTIKTLQNIEMVINAKSAFGFYLDDVRIVQSQQEAQLDKYALLEYVDARDNYIISLIGGSNYGEPEVVGTTREYTKQQNGAQVTLTDAATLSWDLDAAQSARLTATGAIGNTRTLPNSILSAAVDGGNYQLTFIQDGTGGRSITFDTNFEVVGGFDVRANQVTIVTMNVQNGIGYVCVNSFEGLVSGLSNVGGGAVLLTGSNIKSLTQGANITITDNGTSLEIAAAGGGGGGGGFDKDVWVYFIDATNGDDLTGVMGDVNLPFQTVQAALNDFDSESATAPSGIVITLIGAQSYTVDLEVVQYDAKYMRFQSYEECTLEITNANNSVFNYRVVEFDMPIGTLSINSTSGFSNNLQGLEYLYINVGTYTNVASQEYLKLGGAYGVVKIRNFSAKEAAILLDNGHIEIGNADINYDFLSGYILTIAGKGTFTVGNIIHKDRLFFIGGDVDTGMGTGIHCKVGNVTYDGSLSNNGLFIINLYGNSKLEFVASVIDCAEADPDTSPGFFCEGTITGTINLVKRHQAFLNIGATGFITNLIVKEMVEIPQALYGAFIQMRQTADRRIINNLTIYNGVGQLFGAEVGWDNVNNEHLMFTGQNYLHMRHTTDLNWASLSKVTVMGEIKSNMAFTGVTVTNINSTLVNTY